MPRPNPYKSDVVLGEQYKDDLTGLEGKATSTTFFLHGCERVVIEYLDGDKNVREAAFDAPRLTRVATGVTAVSTRTGGSRPGPAPKSTGRR